MVRVEFEAKGKRTTIRIEGRFVGHFAEDAKSVIDSRKISDKLFVDMTSLSWADRTGEDVLVWLASIGCFFVAGNAYSSYVCQKLKLPVIEQAAGEAIASE